MALPGLEEESTENHQGIEMTIDLNDPYEDNDFNIYFDKAQLIQHLNFLEDDNLFKINLLQDEEQNLKKLNDEADKKYKAMSKDIGDVERSI